jgi:uncharacterized protein
MGIETRDGYLSALACSPVLSLPSEFFAAALGGYVFADDREANEIVSLLIRYWNAINDGLQQSLLNKKDVYIPPLLDLDFEQNSFQGNIWAKGFERGFEMHHEDEGLQALIRDEEQGGSLVAIMAFAHENDPDPELRPSIKPEKRDELLGLMIAGLNKIYAYLAPYRHKATQMLESSNMPYERNMPKIGRNDLCYCGSGKKYKRCCYLSMSTVH